MNQISIFLAEFNNKDFIIDVLQGVESSELYNEKAVLTAFICEVSEQTFDSPSQKRTDEEFLSACRKNTWGCVYYVAKRLTDIAYKNYIPKF